MEGIKRNFHAGFLPVLRGGVLDGSENVDLPVHRALKVPAVLICRVDGFRIRIVNNGRRVAIRALLPAIHRRWEHRIVLRLPLNLLNGWFSGRTYRETIVADLVTVPLLS